MNFMLKTNENGSTILITLLFMSLLTIMAMFAIETTIMQQHIVRNERAYRQNFYRAEAAAMEGMQRTENERDKKRLIFKEAVYLNEGNPDNENYIDLENSRNWIVSGEGNPTALPVTDPQTGTPDSSTLYALVDKGVAKGSSLAMNKSTQLHDYWVYGLCRKGTSPILIKMGYRKRY